jgi:hypothetical protein
VKRSECTTKTSPACPVISITHVDVVERDGLVVEI